MWRKINFFSSKLFCHRQASQNSLPETSSMCLCSYTHILKFDCYVAFFDSKKYSLWPKLKKFSLFALTSYMAQNWKSILEVRLRIPLCTTLWKASWISWSGLFPVNEGDVSDGFAKGVVERFGTFLWVNVNARSSDRKPVGSRSKVTN